MKHTDIVAAADLSWFFSTGTSAFERSTSGGMLERARVYALPRQTAAELRDAEPLTAQPMHETRARAGVEFDEATLARYGDLSRRMGRLARRDPLSARALACAFGDEGAKWATHRLGRAVALFSLVPSGIALVKRARAGSKGDLTLSDADRLRVEVVLDGVQGRDAVRRALVARATLEAAELLTGALRAWEGTR